MDTQERPVWVLWALSLPAVLVSAGILLVGFGWLGPFVWLVLSVWVAAAPVMCQRRVQTGAAGGGVRFRRGSDLALLWLTAPWAVTWQAVRAVALGVPLGRSC